MTELQQATKECLLCLFGFRDFAERKWWRFSDQFMESLVKLHDSLRKEGVDVSGQEKTIGEVRDWLKGEH